METLTTAPDYSKMSISEIAVHIYDDMRKTGFRKKSSFAYCSGNLEAMTCLQSINDNYICDSGRTVVAYFIDQAKGWSGETAKAIKAELKKRLKAR